MAKNRKKYKIKDSRQDNSEDFNQDDVKEIIENLEVELDRLLDKLFLSKENEKKIKYSVEIKRKYNNVKRDLKSRGYEIPYEELSYIKTSFMSCIDKFADNRIINEFLQTLANDILTSKKAEGPLKEFIDEEVMEVYKNILGNPGTTTKGMSMDYLTRVINEKLNESDGINREDILSILEEVRNNEYLNEKDYQKLMEDTIIPRLTTNKNGQKISNKRILKIFDSLASSYKSSSDYDKVMDTYGQALNMGLLKGTPEYEEIQKHAEQFEAFLKMKSSFKDRRFESLEELMGSLKGELLAKKIFEKGKGKPRSKNDVVNPPKEKKVMPTEKKLEGLGNVIAFLKKEVDENIDLKEYSIGQNRYEGYVIFKVAGTDISIFENFNDKNNRVYLVKNEKIDEVVNLTKNEARVLDGVEVVNHVPNFDNYCQNFKEKVLRLMGQELPKEKETRFVGASSKRKKAEKNNNKEPKKEEPATETVEENKQEKENKQEVENKRVETEQQIEPEQQVEAEQKIETEQKVETQTETVAAKEEKDDLEKKIQREREKAHKKEEEYRSLLKQLEEINRKADEDIAKAKAEFEKRIKEIDEEE